MKFMNFLYVIISIYVESSLTVLQPYGILTQLQNLKHKLPVLYSYLENSVITGTVLHDFSRG
jgi:hypothetical protein